MSLLTLEFLDTRTLLAGDIAAAAQPHDLETDETHHDAQPDNIKLTPCVDESADHDSCVTQHDDIGQTSVSIDYAMKAVKQSEKQLKKWLGSLKKSDPEKYNEIGPDIKLLLAHEASLMSQTQHLMDTVKTHPSEQGAKEQLASVEKVFIAITQKIEQAGGLDSLMAGVGAKEFLQSMDTAL
ncbi:MAG TPA: hypothetical protein PLV25_07705, partial [Opitutales bacterium]|nr:hypothetical protein [Opitutales bacterium]